MEMDKLDFTVVLKIRQIFHLMLATLKMLTYESFNIFIKIIFFLDFQKFFFKL